MCPSILNLINTVEYIAVIMLGKCSILTIFFIVLVAEMHKLLYKEATVENVKFSKRWWWI